MYTWLFALMLPASLGAHVLIDIAGAAPSELSAAKAGCERALGAGHCHVGDGGASAPARPANRAHVSWNVDSTRARIRFESTSDAHTTTETRELAFAADDAVTTRFEAVGLVVAAYVIGHDQGRADADRAPRAASGPPAPAAPSVVQPEPRWAVDLLLGAGQALSPGAPRFVAGVRGALAPLPLPLFLLVQLDGAAHGDEVDVLYGSAAFGLALLLHTPVHALDLQLHASALVEQISVSGEHPETGGQARENRLRAGGRFGVEVLACVGGPICLFVGARLNAMAAAVRVELLGQTVGRQPAVGVDGLFGVRFGG